MTYREFRGIAAQKIYNDPNCPAEQKDRGTAFFEAENLISHFAFAGLERSAIAAAYDMEMSEECEKKLFAALERKLAGEPLQYILGEWEFYGCRIFCGEGCLIPRPETEFLVDYAIKKLPRNGRFLDICTGSGCISVAILAERHDLSGVAVDISSDALRYAKKNIEYHGLCDRLELVQCDAAHFEPRYKFDLILSNPPYIRSSDMNNLSGEVLREPHIALDGGEDGLVFYRLITERYAKYLNAGCGFAFEAGYDTARGAADILAANGYSAEIIKDYSGIDRIVTGTPKKG